MYPCYTHFKLLGKCFHSSCYSAEKCLAVCVCYSEENGRDDANKHCCKCCFHNGMSLKPPPKEDKKEVPMTETEYRVAELRRIREEKKDNETALQADELRKVQEMPDPIEHNNIPMQYAKPGQNIPAYGQPTPYNNIPPSFQQPQHPIQNFGVPPDLNYVAYPNEDFVALPNENLVALPDQNFVAYPNQNVAHYNPPTNNLQVTNTNHII